MKSTLNDEKKKKKKGKKKLKMKSTLNGEKKTKNEKYFTYLKQKQGIWFIFFAYISFLSHCIC